MAVSLYISVSQNSQSIANNSTNVTVYVSVKWTYGSYNKHSQAGSCTINGTKYNFNAAFNINQTDSGTRTIYTKTVDIAHNADGKKELQVSASYDSGVSSGVIGASAAIELKSIPRAATITSAPNFNDEANPTINYSNPAGNAVSSLEACISLTGAAADVPYRSISKTGSSYTFNLTSEERATLRNAAKNANSISVKFYVRTTISGEQYLNSVTKTLTIINAAPTLAPTAIDKGSVSTVLTGDASGKIIKGYNSIDVAANATAKKGATIKSYKISCGGKSITTASGSLGTVESGDIVFSVTDSRGNTTTQTLKRTLINYVKLTCNLSVTAPTTDGALTFKVLGNYFSGSFGATTNSLTVQYRYKKESGEYSAWTALTPAISGSTYTATGSLSGLDYLSSYTFQARAIDKIYNGNTEPVITSTERKVKTVPVFDWGANDFSFNVPVFVGGKQLAENKMLWNGQGHFMLGSQTINLKEPVSKQANGIVLVFSAYENGTAVDKNFNCFFVPKLFVQNFPGLGINFTLSASLFGNAATKYLYIRDTQITGNDDNDNTGTAGTGIKYTNNAYVLRAVIGV